MTKPSDLINVIIELPSMLKADVESDDSFKLIEIYFKLHNFIFKNKVADHTALFQEQIRGLKAFKSVKILQKELDLTLDLPLITNLIKNHELYMVLRTGEIEISLLFKK